MVGMRLDAEHPDADKFRQAMQIEVERVPERIARIRRTIADLCAPFDAFDVLFTLWSTAGIVRPGTLRPLNASASSATTEYVAHVLLDRENSRPTRAPTKRQLAQGSPNPFRLAELVHEALEWVPMWFQYRQAGGKHATDSYLEMRVRLRTHRIGVRSLSYEWQERATLRELFGPFDSSLREKIGFTVDEALSLCTSLASLPRERVRDHAQAALTFADELRDAVRERRRGGPLPSDAGAPHVEELAALSAADANERIDTLAKVMAFAGAGQHAAFTADQLAAHAGVTPEAAQAFLDLYCVNFGNRADSALYSDDLPRAIGGELEVMRVRPIVHSGDDRYLASSIESVFFSIRDVLTDALKSDQKTWQRFRRRRGERLEERAIEALRRSLVADWAETSVKYELPSVDGTGVEQGEADGVLRAGTVLVLVEAKSGALAPSARRAAPERLETGLTELVTEAHHQLERARRALADGEASKVIDRAGKPLKLDLDGVTRVVRVAVTLEELSAVVPAAWQLQDAGLLPAEARAPWIVDIHSLETICDLVERPAQLVHYVMRRQRSNRQRIWAMDELDFFMKYLDDGLFFDDQDLSGAFMQLNSHTDPLDAYLYGERGLSPQTRRPRQKLNRATRDLLDAIAATESPGAIEAQVMILETSRATRERIAAGVDQLARRSKRDGQPHDMTLVFGDDFAITVVSVPQELRTELNDRLAALGSSRFERSTLGRWLGLGVPAGSKGKLSAMAVLVAPDRVESAEQPHPLVTETIDSKG